ncbi:hypothetical protein niasHT_002273 [Heterodera trifolii]|uniref:Uncharacterized protein n=1 Tax=Heterodera trifolii TaxID=157864 RepID=A0ABD2LNC5_9BILA
MENSVQVNGKEVPIFGQRIKMNGAEAQSLCPCPMLLLFSADIIIVSGAVCIDSILLLVVMLQICILLLMLLFCFCSLRLATRCHTYSVNARRSIARRTQRAAAATLTAFNSRTSAPPHNVSEPLAIRGRRVAHETATTTTTHRVSGSV